MSQSCIDKCSTSRELWKRGKWRGKGEREKRKLLQIQADVKRHLGKAGRNNEERNHIHWQVGYFSAFPSRLIIACAREESVSVSIIIWLLSLVLVVILENVANTALV